MISLASKSLKLNTKILNMSKLRLLNNLKNLMICIYFQKRENLNRVRFDDSILLEGGGIYHKQRIEETLLCQNQLILTENSIKSLKMKENSHNQ